MSIEFSDEFIDGLFENTDFGTQINASTDLKRELIGETLQNQIDGYWSGSTAYSIVVNAGFLIDSKSGSEKKLTALGEEFMKGMKS